MSQARTSAPDTLVLIASVGMSLAALGLVGCGVAMFWGPLRQVLLAPVVIGIGAMGYVASRALWWTVHESPSRPA